MHTTTRQQFLIFRYLIEMRGSNDSELVTMLIKVLKNASKFRRNVFVWEYRNVSAGAEEWIRRWWMVVRWSG